MDGLNLEVLRTARAWHVQGWGVTLVTVTSAWRAAPRPAGAMMAVRDDGRTMGSVSNGCVEEDLIVYIRDISMDDMPRVLTYDVSAEEAERCDLSCGGTLQLVVEAVTDVAWLDNLLGAIKRNEWRARRLDMRTGQIHLEPCHRPFRPDFDGRILRTVHGPGYPAAATVSHQAAMAEA